MSAGLLTSRLEPKRHLRVLATGILSLFITFALSGPALAWKPITHVYFSELVLQDVIDDGMVTIWATDYETGRLELDSQGSPIVIGTYSVSREVYVALVNYPAQFRAGTLGPDAYPDIITGQTVIHPAGHDLPGEPPGVDVNMGGPGPDPWLTYLYSRAFTGCNPDGSDCNPADVTPANQAFVIGFLTHAAEDMYGHSFINYYTGGPFHFTPQPENAIKHTVFEGYIGRRTPPLFPYNASIGDGVEDFIYRNMINATPGSFLDSHLLKGSGAQSSLPRVFSTLRAQLQRNIDEYYRTVTDYESRYDQKIREAEDCAPLDFSCSATFLRAEAKLIRVLLDTYRTTYGAWVTYQAAWRDDIDIGLNAFPEFSHELAIALFFNPNGMDTDRAQQLAEDYKNRYLLSMLGAPDEVGLFLDSINQIINALPFDEIEETIAQMKEDLLNYILEQAFGISLDDIHNYLTSPERYFDNVMSSEEFNRQGTGNPLTLQTFNPQMGIQDPGFQDPTEYFDYTVFPPAYNSAIMTKLLMMSPEAVQQLLVDLGSTQSFQGPNAMLGFIGTLDGSRQWYSNPAKMILAVDSCAYEQIFMRQIDELEAPRCGT